MEDARDAHGPAEAALPMRGHPDRPSLVEEVNARPPLRIESPARVSHVVMLTGEGGADGDRAHLDALCARLAMARPDAAASQHVVWHGTLGLRWERHTEFSSWTVVDQAEAVDTAAPFDRPPLDLLPGDWLRDLPGELIACTHVNMLSPSAPPPDEAMIVRLFERPIGGPVAGDVADIWTDLRVQDGATRFLVHDRALTAGQRGRTVQRLLEIETYRVLALLGFPLARRFGSDVTDIDRRLAAASARLPDAATTAEQQDLLDIMLALSAEIERIATATNYRFGAVNAYYDLVQRRIEELREGRAAGLQPLGQFLLRRLTPAIRTCNSLRERQETLSRRLARASTLLRSRVELDLARQNRALLASMDRRSRLQLRLQRTVEGLSVVAITYYAVGLFAHLTKGAEHAGWPIPHDLAVAASVPVIAAIVWLAVHRIRHALTRD